MTIETYNGLDYYQADDDKWLMRDNRYAKVVPINDVNTEGSWTEIPESELPEGYFPNPALGHGE